LGMPHTTTPKSFHHLVKKSGLHGQTSLPPPISDLHSLALTLTEGLMDQVARHIEIHPILMHVVVQLTMK